MPRVARETGMNEKRLLTIREFLTRYSVSRTLLYRLWSTNAGPNCIRVGRRVLIPVDSAEEWVRRQQADGTLHGASTRPSHANPS